MTTEMSKDHGSFRSGLGCTPSRSARRRSGSSIPVRNPAYERCGPQVTAAFWRITHVAPVLWNKKKAVVDGAPERTSPAPNQKPAERPCAPVLCHWSRLGVTPMVQAEECYATTRPSSSMRMAMAAMDTSNRRWSGTMCPPSKSRWAAASARAFADTGASANSEGATASK